MQQQTIMWTALPNGIADGKLRISVFISPRLKATATSGKPKLEVFPDFLDWPAFLAAATFQVRFGNSTPVPAQRVLPPVEPAPSSLWKAVFKSNCTVDTWDYNPLQKFEFNSFPIRNILQDLRETIVNLAIDEPYAPPKLDLTDIKTSPVSLMLSEVAGARLKRAEIKQEISGHMNSAKTRSLKFDAVPSSRALMTGPGRKRAATVMTFKSALPKRTMEYHMVEAFHVPDIAKVDNKWDKSPVKMMIPAPDFHKLCTSMGQYPDLMRRMGLVIDLEVPYDAALNSATTVRIVPQVTSTTPTALTTPRTRCRISATEFVAQASSEDWDVSNGFLELNDAEIFEVGQVDVDSAALQMINIASRVSEQTPQILTTYKMNKAIQPLPEINEKPDSPVPQLRSAGLWVARVNRASEMAEVRLPSVIAKTMAVQKAEIRHFKAVDAVKATPSLLVFEPAEDSATELTAEDLVRGYRVDIQDMENEQWRSLCQRIGAYSFKNPDGTPLTSLQVTDEGWISSAATQPADGSSDKYFVHETLFRWEGWSLVAPRPGAPVENEDDVAPMPTNLGLEIDFTVVPGTLPRLRFGHEYRVRARAVDLAGNGLGPVITTDINATEPVTYARHEPVNSPAIVPRKDVTSSKGEFPHHLIIRSLNDAPAKDTVKTPSITERHVVPPKTSPQMAELHGMFDDASKLKDSAFTWKQIIDHDDALKTFYDADDIKLPYLPDPLAIGARFVLTTLDVAGKPFEQTVSVMFAGNWPEINTFRVKVQDSGETPAQMAFNETTRILTIQLLKGQVAELSVSSIIPAEYLPQMGIWRWTAEKLTRTALEAANLPLEQRRQVMREVPQVKSLSKYSDQLRLERPLVQQIEKFAKEAQEGRVWLITPAQKMTLIHACQQPLGIPVLKQLKNACDFGATFTNLWGNVPVDGKSTASVRVVAKWKEPLDDIAVPAPQEIEGQDTVFDISVNVTNSAAKISASGLITSTHQIQGIVPMMLTLPAQEAPKAQPGAAPAVKPMMRKLDTPIIRDQSHVSDTLKPSSELIMNPGLVRNDMIGLTIPETPRRHELGDTKYRKINYQAITNTRHSEYFDMPVEPGTEKSPYDRISEPVTLDVFNSARPASPKVLYVIPTFNWDRNDLGAEMNHTRRGGGLRVYLERPWFSSGEGELLGVIIAPWSSEGAGAKLMSIILDAETVMVDNLKPYVTQIGADPTWRTAPTPAFPPRDSFKLAQKMEGSLTLEELGDDRRVGVAGHAVAYDPDRQLWYCDIEIDPGNSYFPFVRLALARYQPMSVMTPDWDVKLSRVTVADFVQLTPDRTATVTPNSRDKNKVNVSVTGFSGVWGRNWPNRITVMVEQKIASREGELAWMPMQLEETELTYKFQRNETFLWSGEITLPTARGTKPMRIVIREYESIMQESLETELRKTMAVSSYATRLVYADSFILR